MRSSGRIVPGLNSLKFLLNVTQLGRERIDLRVNICVGFHNLLEYFRLHLFHIIGVVIGLFDPFLLGQSSSVHLLDLSASLFL